ncbi:hypothetical protein LbFV_ORF21 [Leptopilina boulardi filamentous virus]|uniref:Uncharacterized protein n=1 Tax=Leptopilina boulardi filamentous virus TaxID=552509 RepID=A0A1S5YCZ6_9VIRU|nr:hypothetical protein LbFV_ORF21 [Leptopilina boulardi filamentous virus]AQQ79941.1 hypothetical protein LbFV_ORF21 [Leptopilina boulardi filamentous virus]
MSLIVKRKNKKNSIINNQMLALEYAEKDKKLLNNDVYFTHFHNIFLNQDKISNELLSDDDDDDEEELEQQQHQQEEESINDDDDIDDKCCKIYEKEDFITSSGSSSISKECDFEKKKKFFIFINEKIHLYLLNSIKELKINVLNNNHFLFQQCPILHCLFFDTDIIKQQKKKNNTGLLLIYSGKKKAHINVLFSINFDDVKEQCKINQFETIGILQYYHKFIIVLCIYAYVLYCEKNEILAVVECTDRILTDYINNELNLQNPALFYIITNNVFFK